MKNKTPAFLFLTTLLSLFLRIYKIASSMRFTGDFAWYFLSAKDMLLTGKIPLVGIPSSVPVLKQGALYTWLLAIVLFFGKFNPLSGVYLNILLATFSVFLIFIISKRFFGENVALISTAFFATSPLIIRVDREPFVIGTLFLLTLIVVLFLTSVIERGKSKYCFLLGLILGIIFQFELAGFILVPIIFLTLIFSKIKQKAKCLIKLIGGGLVGIIPLLYYDLNQGVFIQTLGFAIWVVTKFFEGVLKIFTPSQSAEIISPFLSFITELIHPKSPIFALLVLFLSFCLFFVRFALIKKYQDFSTFLILIWLMIGVGGFFLRGIYSKAYMPFVYFPIIIIISTFLSWFVKKNSILGWFVVLIIVASNVVYSIKSIGTKGISLSEQLQVVGIVLKDTKDNKFRLSYFGPYDNFHSADNNYHYLLWWKGNEPVYSADREYIIWEGEENKDINADLLGNIENKVFIYEKIL